MVSVEEFALEERKLGRRVHQHNGVWWVKKAPFYCKPVHEFRAFPQGESGPSIFESIAGYSHQVLDASQATLTQRWMVLSGDSLRNFSLMLLPGKKRNQVRGGLKHCEIKLLNGEKAILEEMRLINISQAKRFQEAGEKGSFLHHSYYQLQAAKWQAEIMSLFRHPGHRFYGAWCQGRLAAYADVLEIEDTMLFGAVKSHTDLLSYRPVDAIYYNILEAAGKDTACIRVVNGGPDDVRKGVTDYKVQFLFEPVAVPYFRRSVIKLRSAKKIMNTLSRARRQLVG